MKEMVFISIMVSFLADHFSIDCNTNRQRLQLSPPLLEILHDGKPLTADAIQKLSPVEGQLLPIELRLGEPSNLRDSLGNVDVYIDSAEVIFIIDKKKPRKRTMYKGHLVLMSVHWPSNFPLVKGSVILFKVKYSYKRNDNIIGTGKVMEEVIL